MSTNESREAIARALAGPAASAPIYEEQLTSADAFAAALAARGFAIIPKSDADQFKRVQRKTGGTHSVTPGKWQVNSTDQGWVSFWAGFNSNENPGMFSPGEAREIAMALIAFAAQEERRR